MSIEFANYLDKDFRLLKSVIPPTMDQLSELRSQLNCDFPQEYLDYLAENGATYLQVKEEVWKKPQQYEIRPAWEMMSTIIVLGISSEEEKANFPDMLNLVKITEEFQPMFNSSLIPFFKWESDNIISCFDQQGKIFNLSYGDPENPEPIEMTFNAFIESQIEKLVENKNKYKEKGTESKTAANSNPQTGKRTWWQKLFGRN